MQDYYTILGVDANASQEDIKKAYRSLAMKHHPDRGGDQSMFKDISAAYDTLSDPNKKAEYDQMRNGGAQFRFRSGSFDEFNDIFGHGSPFGAHFQDIFGRHIRRNRDLNINCTISLLDSFLGKQLEAAYNLPSGKPQSVVINIPQGTGHGATIRYQGLGDDTFPNVPRGNLNVTINILEDPVFSRNGDDLYTTVEISPIDAMIGCKRVVKSITGQEINLTIPQGAETGKEFAIAGKGFRNPYNNTVGRFVSVLKIKTPIVTDPKLIEKLRQLNDDIKR